MSGKFCTAERSTLRPMRPKPLMPILIANPLLLCFRVSPMTE
jgi:hypothetical protein